MSCRQCSSLVSGRIRKQRKGLGSISLAKMVREGEVGEEFPRTHPKWVGECVPPAMSTQPTS
jgi:hypothetical protein